MPVKPRFLIGDTMSIICTAPASKDRIQGFRFSRMPGLVTDFRSSKRTFVHTFNITGPQDGGFYTCSYTVFRGSHSSTQSLKSQAVVINVQDRPAKPNLTVTPSSVTIEGQPLVFFCAAPPGDAERRFGFFQGELKVTDGIQEDSGAAGVRLRVEKSGLNQTGNFSCRYEEMTEGRWIESYASDAIQVIVKDPCPPPHLSVEPPSGVVAVGHRLRLTCAAPRDNFRRRFRFFRDGAEVTSGTGDTRDTRDGAELLFPQISQELAGNFSCRVEEEVGGAWGEGPPRQGRGRGGQGPSLPAHPPPVPSLGRSGRLRIPNFPHLPRPLPLRRPPAPLPLLPRWLRDHHEPPGRNLHPRPLCSRGRSRTFPLPVRGGAGRPLGAVPTQRHRHPPCPCPSSVWAPPIGHRRRRRRGRAAPGAPIGCLAVPEEEGWFPLAGAAPRGRHRGLPHGGRRSGQLRLGPHTQRAAP
ncbi:PREDICTED: Fc receptor-like protein 6, partial [Corvus brachyrhynchos]|uniref:Fc receptor-like protein 6 n=1 Tax=Corvus brachyrhynchos TaxID=85066 RepID=UPI00081644D8